MHLQDVIANEHYQEDRLWSSSLCPPDRRRWVRHLQWFWHVKADAWMRRAVALLAVALGLLILASEAAILFPWADLSFISFVVHWGRLSPLLIECFTLVLLVYLAVCTYSSFMKVRIFRYYRLVPHSTDERSLLFYAAYLSRLAFPLGSNYLLLIEGHGGKTSLVTEFSKVAASSAPSGALTLRRSWGRWT